MRRQQVYRPVDLRVVIPQSRFRLQVRALEKKKKKNKRKVNER